MNLILTNILVKHRSVIELKHFFVKNKLKLLSVVYGIWIVLSAATAYGQPHKYALYFTDLPDYLKNTPPFLLSFIYLVLFIPAVACIILFMFYFLFNVIKSVFFK